MSFKSFIRKNKFFSFITIGFIFWIGFLILLGLVSNRTVLFYDSLNEEHVSSDYTSSYSLLRYLIEPIYGLTLISGDPLGWIPGFLIILIILRVIYYQLKKRDHLKSEKFDLLTYLFYDFISFTFKVMGLTFLISFGLILTFYFTLGYHFVGTNFMLMIQIAIPIAFILIALKAGTILAKLIRTDLKFNFPVKRKGVDIKRNLVYTLGIGFLILGVNALLLFQRFPTHIIETDLDNDEFLLDFHVHDTTSDGWLSPEERVMWYIDHGIDGAAFSNHDNLRGARAAREFVERYNLDFFVIIAEEWTDSSNDIHMNIFGLEETIVPLESKGPYSPRALDAKHTIKRVKALDGYITANHYNYRENSDGGFGEPYTVKELRDWGIDGFEITNGGSYSGKYKDLREFCLDNNLTCIGGSDIHTNQELNTFTKLKVPGVKDARDLTVSKIFKSLKKNDHEIIAVDLYPERVNIPNELDDFLPLQRFFNYFLNIDCYQAISWIIWSSGALVIFSLIFRKIKKADVKALRYKIL